MQIYIERTGSRLSTYLNGGKAPPEHFENCPQFLERYLNYLYDFKGYTSATVVENYVALREYLQFLRHCNTEHTAPTTKDAHKDISIAAMNLPEAATVSCEQIERYLCFLDTVVRNGRGTLCKKLSLIRRFYAYLENCADELGLANYRSPAADLSVPAPTEPAYPRGMNILTPKQISRLMDGVTGIHAKRDRAMIHLIVTTGISVVEAADAVRKDLQGTKLTVGRDAKRRTVYLTQPCLESIQDYLNSPMIRELDAASEYPSRTPLFLPEKGYGHMTPRSIQVRISKASAISGITATANDLQDTAVSIFLQTSSVFELEQIMRYFGYESPKAFRSRFGKLFPKELESQDPILRAVSGSALAELR